MKGSGKTLNGTGQRKKVGDRDCLGENSSSMQHNEFIDLPNGLLF